jgi:CubicO group peptidase (beta-lactamase class C family)
MISMRLFAGVLALFVFAAAARADAIDTIVTEEKDKTDAPGVIVGIVGKDGAPVTRRYGLANHELNVPVSDQTIFQSGSLGKQFTAVAVMLMVEDGKLELDKPITTYLRNAPRTWRKITVRHLLTHTSGLPDYPNAFDVQRNYSEEELEAFARTLRLQFKPGDAWSYSNPGYMLLGILVHEVSGDFYGDVLKDRVFKKLGMTTARVISEVDIVPNRAAGYRSVRAELKNQEWVAPELNTTADGALYLTVLDLIAWDKGLREGAILKPGSWREVFTPVELNNGSRYPYGFGWFLDDDDGKQVQWHTGSWQGFKAAIFRYTRREVTVIVLANHAAFDAKEVAKAIGRQLP